MALISKTPFSVAAAAVARRDRVMAGLMKRTGPFRLPQTGRTHFAALAESIHYQQLAGAAAAAIHGRFIALFGGKPFSPCIRAGCAPPGSRAARSPRCAILPPR